MDKTRLLAALLISTIAGGTAAADDFLSKSGLDKLRVYDGVFELKTTYYKTAYSTAHTDDMVVTTRCAMSPGYYVCNQIDKTEPPKLIVYTYSAQVDEYYAYFIPGDTEHHTAGMLLKTAGPTWTYSAILKDAQGKPVSLRDINVFKDADHIEGEEDYSEDGVHWTTMSKTEETRVKDPAS